jgi:hypothetical protein
MYIAAQKGHLEIVQCLVEHGASANAAAGKIFQHEKKNLALQIFPKKLRFSLFLCFP